MLLSKCNCSKYFICEFVLFKYFMFLNISQLIVYFSLYKLFH